MGTALGHQQMTVLTLEGGGCPCAKGSWQLPGCRCGTNTIAMILHKYKTNSKTTLQVPGLLLTHGL